jgi:phospholipase C
MIIISPYAKPGYVDHTTANHASMLAFTEHLFGLPPLTAEDAGAYDYVAAFDFSQQPLAPKPLPLHRVPPSSIRYIAQHPPDPDDPT